MSSRRVTKTWTQENTWKCNSCPEGTVNLGRFMKCQVCGSPKEKDETDIEAKADESKALTDPNQLRDAGAGEDWICEFCTGRVKNLDGKCGTCSAGRDIAEAGSKYDVKTNADGVVTDFNSNDGRVKIHTSGGGTIRGLNLNGKQVIDSEGHLVDGKKPSKPVKSTFPPLEWRFWKKKDSWTIWGAPAILGTAALIVLGFYLFGTREIRVQVARTNWEYTVMLHQKTLMQGEGWGSRTSNTYFAQPKPDGYGPKGDSFNVSCEGRRYGTEDCDPYRCHEHTVNYDCHCTQVDCNCHSSQHCTSGKNGYSQCQEVETCGSCSKCDSCQKTEYETCYHTCTVYKDYCTYSYYEWPIVATQATGGTTRAIYWPELKALGPDQRLDQVERYTVIFTKENKAQANNPDRWIHNPGSLTEYDYFAVGATWLAEVNRFGSIWPKHVVTP